MLDFYLTVPFMILAIAIAVGPLIWTIRHHQEWEGSPMRAASPAKVPDERVAA
jgi:hypothetical protein